MDMLQKDKVTKTLLFIAVLALIIFAFTYANDNDEDIVNGVDNQKENMEQDLSTINTENPVVILKTTMGDIVLELYMDKTPITVGNFLKLSREDFYTGTKFHRVIDNFMIQGGDPNSKGDNVASYGLGGPGYTIKDEFDPELSNLRGTISMANTGQPDSGGSQFFINYTDNIQLDNIHTVFGHVLQGLDVLDIIAKTETGGNDLPISAIIIEDVVIVQNTDDGSVEDTGDTVKE